MTNRNDAPLHDAWSNMTPDQQRAWVEASRRTTDGISEAEVNAAAAKAGAGEAATLAAGQGSGKPATRANLEQAWADGEAEMKYRSAHRWEYDLGPKGDEAFEAAMAKAPWRTAG